MKLAVFVSDFKLLSDTLDRLKADNKGHKVNIWFSGNAAGSVKAHQKHLKDYSTGEKTFKGPY